MRHTYLFTSLVEGAKQKILDLTTPFHYANGEVIMVGDVVRSTGIMDDEEFEEIGVVDFVMGCLTIVVPGIEIESPDDLMLLYDFDGKLEKVQNEVREEIFEKYLSDR
ncbi:hypothetical protein [Sphingobacterium detergens]|uniref:hypothetical protein n=1 Tax=Sphingobacterium detergens TaxID=1145106 RepID=UPI003AAF8CE1